MTSWPKELASLSGIAELLNALLPGYGAVPTIACYGCLFCDGSLFRSLSMSTLLVCRIVGRASSSFNLNLHLTMPFPIVIFSFTEITNDQFLLPTALP